MGVKLPDDLVADLVESGMGNTAIQRELERRFGTKVTRQAISVWKKRRGYEVRPMLYDWSPWGPIPEEDRDYEVYRIIRWYERRKRGLPLTDAQNFRVDSVIARVLEGDRYVFDYRPDHPAGPWVAVPRRPQDEGITRKPDA